MLIEGGFAWLAPLMWRMDRAFELLGSEAPKLTAPPSEVIREHVWLTTQPMDEPERTADLPRAVRPHGHGRPDHASRPTTRTGTSTRRSARSRVRSARTGGAGSCATTPMRCTGSAMASHHGRRRGRRDPGRAGARSSRSAAARSACSTSTASSSRCATAARTRAARCARAGPRRRSPRTGPGEYELGRPGEILRCPWHAWEFDIRTGRSWFDPERTRVKAYPVEVRHAETFPVSVEDDYVVVEL